MASIALKWNSVVLTTKLFIKILHTNIVLPPMGPFIYFNFACTCHDLSILFPPGFICSFVCKHQCVHAEKNALEIWVWISNISLIMIWSFRFDQTILVIELCFTEIWKCWEYDKSENFDIYKPTSVHQSPNVTRYK